MKNKIIFFDIDGTLIFYDGEKSVMPDSTKVAIKKLRENGNLVFISSGRPIRFILQEFEGMFDGFICGNGTYLIYKGGCIYNRLIDESTLEQLLKAFKKLDLGCSFSGAYHGYAYNMDKDKIVVMNSFYNRGDSYMIEKWDVKEIKANMLDIFFKDKIHLKKCIEYFGDELIFNSHGGHTSADVSFKDWDKADGVKYLIEYLKMNFDDTIAFGDGKNDISMLKTVKTGIAMGNAVDELKEIATFVTENVLDDGIYKALDKLHLI